MRRDRIHKDPEILIMSNGFQWFIIISPTLGWHCLIFLGALDPPFSETCFAKLGIFQVKLDALGIPDQ